VLIGIHLFAYIRRVQGLIASDWRQPLSGTDRDEPAVLTIERCASALGKHLARPLVECG
jgi:hypothetical protein